MSNILVPWPAGTVSDALDEYLRGHAVTLKASGQANRPVVYRAVME